MPLNTTVKNRIKGIERIGPHSKDIVSIIFGSLLGDAHAEKRKNGNEATHVKYLSWMHNQFAIAGYCNPVIPKIGQRLGKNNKVRQISIGNYLTPKVSKGLKLCTNSYSYSDCLLLVQVLHSNFGLKATIQSTESMDKLRNIVDPFIIPEMKYKILP
ncbi:homing endonuclease [Tuber indicum]|nr:homing endonuclease [Tuber indicum]